MTEPSMPPSMPLGDASGYGQVCGIALALDAVGSRWALLILRDLAHAPLRFSDLMAKNPGLSPGVLSTRLQSLTGSGLIEQRETRGPARATVYALTGSTSTAVTGLLANLAELGSQLLDTTPLNIDPAPAFAAQLELNSRTVLAQQSTLQGHFLLDFGFWQNHIIIDGGTMSAPVEPPAGDGPDATASFAPPTTLMRLVGQALTAEEAEHSGQLTITGDRAQMLELLKLLSIGPR